MGKEYLQFLGIANGSLKELETLLLLAQDLNYIDDITKTTLPRRRYRIDALM